MLCGRVPPESVQPSSPPSAVSSVAPSTAHAQLWAELAQAGVLIGPHDLWLSATCVAYGLTMVTANVREFVRVPGLEFELWTD